MFVGPVVAIGCRTQASTMQGFDGNYVALLDSGVIVLRFMDEFDKDIEDLLRRSERVESSCDGSTCATTVLGGWFGTSR